MDGKTRVEQASISAIVIRKDGTKDDLGTISFWHRNPFRRFWWRLRHEGRRHG
jgi:hypothetical protein